MSMKMAGAGTRNGLAGLLLAALMIGCGSSERNSPGAPGEAGGPAVASDGGYSARGVDAAGGVPESDGRSRSAEEAAAAAAPPTVLFIGTSLTAGQGLPVEQSFPLVVERRIDATGLPFRVVNAGVSGETSAGALRRIDWLLRQPFDVVVLETGANDMLRGIDSSSTEQNIQAIVDRIRSHDPDAPIVLAGMFALPNLGEAYTREFEAIFPRLAERNDLALIPFLLEGVAGERELNQGDGVHPTAEGQLIIAETVWGVLEPVLAALAVEAGG
jgi:acyl-CoA thioesterase I